MRIKMIHNKLRSHYGQLDLNQLDPDDADQIYIAAMWTQ